MTKAQMKKFIEDFDFAALAEAYNLEQGVWHEMEWKRFINVIREAEHKRILECLEMKNEDVRGLASEIWVSGRNKLRSQLRQRLSQLEEGEV